MNFLRKLSEICPVVVMRGTPNHDSAEQFTTLENTFKGNCSLSFIMEPEVRTYYSYTGKKIQIACLPGFDRGYFRAKHPGLSKEEENEIFTRSIKDMIIGLKAQCDADSPTILVSHYTVTGCNMESGQTAFFSQFEPVIYPSTLVAANFDLVCLGHIHRPQRLDGCKNTFYCGAISALNFSDEGQARGYWLHDIVTEPAYILGVEPPIPSVVSTFQPLPTREYLTIRLDDDDVREINENGPGWLNTAPIFKYADEAKDKVVRVLYDCTDEHNKAFNHTTLTSWLYNVGKAFWVQEVTPQKITITVDRRSMDADSTPEGNLVDYLAEKEFTPERIGEIIELARPIIAEATEKATMERHTGLFVPVEIEVKNYRNYREETFSFENIHFCTINGSNGVGKSSFFMDAMLDALFEQPREGELTGWICNASEARSGMIKFTFKLGESLYRVTRTRQKSGKPTLNISEFVEGEWIDRSKEKLADTQQEITNIIGMDSLTLKACALIMQDQYGLFLQADKEARMNILGSILGLGIYGGMEELAADRAADVKRTIRTMEDRVETITAGLPDRAELALQIHETEEQRKKFEEQIQQKIAEVDNFKIKLAAQIEAAGRAIKLNSKITALTAQKSTKETAKTSQVGIIMAADTILAGEAEIIAGMAKYNFLLEQEKKLIRDKATYDNLVIRKKQIEGAIMLAKTSAKEIREKKVALTLMKIEPLQQTLSREDELAGKHIEYEKTIRQITELEALAPDYEAKKAAVQTTQAEIDHLDQEYKTTHERLTLQLDTLGKKVELLSNSGCPDVEKASCKFLADALEAKKLLPAAEAAVADLESEYVKNHLKASEALTLAQKELADSLYHPEEINILRGVQRDLEVAEREYHNLEAQKNELKLLIERATEFEKAITDAEATAEKGQTELAEVTMQLTKVVQISADYDRLQAEIAVARQWIEKEKQIPVAREKKTAAAQRILELDTELKSIEEEIIEAREELVQEQSKTIGKEELQMQVDRVEEMIRTLQEHARGAAVMLGGFKKQMEQTEKILAEAAELQKQVNVLAVKAAGYEELKKAFSQDGIPHNIIRSIIPIFEATATNILGQMSQGHMSVEFVTEKVLKSNNKKEVTTLDIIINDSGTGRLPYMSRSGGERVKAALSVILALSEIKSSKAGVQLGFLFIDEPPFLDAPGVQAYCDALEAIQQRYTNLKVMAITHDPAMKSRFPQSIDVIKTTEGSKVIYE